MKHCKTNLKLNNKLECVIGTMNNIDKQRN